MDQTEKKGGISVETEHIFPIIKKWLYSEKDIFLREIVSNASDAVTKLRRLASLGQTELDGSDFRITVELDKAAGTITVCDNGIGMTEDEVRRYICSIALSGALDFVQKYENGDNSNGIIGHFGLGFYSSFMISDVVEIDTKSYDGSPAVHWTCNEAGEYEISPSSRTERGTSVTMHVCDAEKEYLDPTRILGILDKYCAFMPVPIYFSAGEENAEGDEQAHNESDAKPVNTTVPLWCRPASEITEEEYNELYHKLFFDPQDPLFHVHINADYPLNFKGILFFPRIRQDAQSLEGEVKLFYNQVFVADNVKEVLPDYLLMLKGALDCPELPLNVSRSYLQDDAYVKKMSKHIVKKVADKLNSLATNEREKYEKLYADIRIFLEFACLRERGFYDKVKNSLLLRLTDGKCETYDEYLEKAKEKHEGKIYYTTDPALQAQHVAMLRDNGIEVAVFDLSFDSQFLSSIEQYGSGIKFIRVDSGIDSSLIADCDRVDVDERLVSAFKAVSGNEKLTVKAESLKNAEIPAVLSVSEESRRLEDMIRLYSVPGDGAPEIPLDYTLTLNSACPLYEKLSAMAKDAPDDKKTVATIGLVYRLALLTQKKPSADELSALLKDGYDLMELI